MSKRWADEHGGCWKFGLILIGMELDDESEICELVELYPLGRGGKYTSFCKARINSLVGLKNAYKDVERDGVDRYFYDNGTFEWKWKDGLGWWDWTPNDLVEGDGAEMNSESLNDRDGKG